MKNWWRWGILMALYIPLITIPAIRPSDGKELRPSDHGLPNQGDEDQAKAPQMSSFFGNGSASSTTTTQPLPEAQNFTDSSSSTTAGGGGGGGGGDRVKKLPGNGKQLEFGSMKTNGKAIAVHTLIFFVIYAILVLAVHIHIYTG
ncbi:hypothetical protein OSB04_026841 [Centaurea solstitialis]|uniref:Uncharacterized protein n=1 Tax=Centaurea solstitialis TaxID=347529 RepID=A0AA38W693_9ASTR|nr:hypothetical protein OSB04_026841 [Centaurea solstitialis]